MAKSIAVAGKGGTGKTTIAALIIQYLCEKRMGPVLAIDADPDANLGTLLGITVEKTVGDLREDILKEIKNLPAGMTKASYIEGGLHQIIEESSQFDLITMGKGEGPGCYCYLNSLIRKFYEDLTPSYSWIVMDNEAGLEHISRRTTSNIDTLLVVVTENPISFETAAKINTITKTINNGIRQKYVVSNMIGDDKKQRVRERVEKLEMEYLGDIPRDSILEDTLFNGNSLLSLENSSAKQRIYSFMEKVGG